MAIMVEMPYEKIRIAQLRYRSATSKVLRLIRGLRHEQALHKVSRASGSGDNASAVPGNRTQKWCPKVEP